jgi:hypothetical protein
LVVLRFVAWANLIGGLMVGMWIWKHVESEAGLAAGYMFAGLAGCVVLLVLAQIAEELVLVRTALTTQEREN